MAPIWTGSEELELHLTDLVALHDEAYDGMTGAPEHRLPTPMEKSDPEARYHWAASDALEVVLHDLRTRPNYADLCPRGCGCRGNR